MKKLLAMLLVMLMLAPAALGETEEEAVSFVFTPMTNPEFAPVALAMMSSIQKVK